MTVTEDDPLMLALTGGPVPPTRRQDARFLAEYQAAVADLALLREQVHALGDALGQVAPGESPRATAAGRSNDVTAAVPSSIRAAGPERARPRLRPRPQPDTPGRARRRLTVALGAVAVACAAALLIGFGWLLVGSGGAQVDDQAASSSARDSGSAPDAAQGVPSPGRAPKVSPSKDPHYVACARLIAEGTLTKAERLPGGAQYRITVRVERYYRPAEGAPEVTFVRSTTALPPPRVGERVLVGIPEGAPAPDLWSTGSDISRDRAWITAALDGGRDTGCR